DDHFFTVLLDGHAELLDMVDAVAVGQNLAAVSEELAGHIELLLSNRAEEQADDDVLSIDALPVAAIETAEPEQTFTIENEDADALGVQSGDEIRFDEVQADAESSADASENHSGNIAGDDVHTVAEEDNSRDIEEVDLEVFEIFIEEAEELLEEI